MIAHRPVVRLWLSLLFLFWAVLASAKWYDRQRRVHQQAIWLSHSTGAVGERELRVDDRPVLVYAPVSRNARRPAPLVMLFHGRRQRHDRFIPAEQRIAWAERSGFIMAAPAGLAPDGERNWEVRRERDLEFIDRVLARLKRDYRVDRRRVYLYGFSAGGYFALFYAWHRSDRIAAFTVNSAGWLPWLAATTSRKVPAILIHGDRDGIVPIGDMEQAATKLREAGHEVKVRRVAGGGHSLFAEHLPEVAAFFRSHPLPTRSES